MQDVRKQTYSDDCLSPAIKWHSIVERLHRQLKATIKCHDSDNWVAILPIVLLGIRTAVKDDLKVTAAEMIYGTNIRLPAEFFLPTDFEPNSQFVSRLKRHFNDVKPRPIVRNAIEKCFVFRELFSSPYMFLRHGAVKSPFQPPYDGPYEVFERTNKNFVIKVNNKNVRVLIDRLKPAFIIPNECNQYSSSEGNFREVIVETEMEAKSTTENHADPSRFCSRSGRNIHFLKRLQAGFR